MPRLDRVHACLLAIPGFLPLRIPACIAPILLWNVLNIWTRSTKAWGLLLSGLMAVTTTILLELESEISVITGEPPSLPSSGNILRVSSAAGLCGRSLDQYSGYLH